MPIQLSCGNRIPLNMLTLFGLQAPTSSPTRRSADASLPSDARSVMGRTVRGTDRRPLP